MDTGEPFGLPKGTVRGVIALAFAALLVASYWATKTLDPVLAAFTLPYIAWYFAIRPTEPSYYSVGGGGAEDPVGPPFIPGGDVSK